MSLERREFANIAISSAISALVLILEDEPISRSVVGVPLYLLTTIAFAAIFLVKVQLRWKSARLNIDSSQVCTLLERIVDMLSNAKASERHLSYHMARGLQTILGKFKERELREQEAASSHNSIGTKLHGADMVGTMPVDQPGGWHNLNAVADGMYGDVIDLYGLDQESYFPLGIFDVLSSQMPG